jgi:hypothetical protein
MTSLSRRLERLEAGCQQNDEFVAERCRFIQQQAIQRLSTDQVGSCLTITVCRSPT